MIHLGICASDTHTAVMLKQFSAKLGIQNIAISLYRNDFKYDTVLITPSACVSGLAIAARLVIAPDCIDLSTVSKEFGDNVISYGMLSKNTVTASSITPECISVAIQRKFPTVCDNTVDEQEFTVRSELSSAPEAALGIITALLTLGIPPCNLRNL